MVSGNQTIGGGSSGTIIGATPTSGYITAINPTAVNTLLISSSTTPNYTICGTIKSTIRKSRGTYKKDRFTADVKLTVGGNLMPTNLGFNSVGKVRTLQELGKLFDSMPKGASLEINLRKEV